MTEKNVDWSAIETAYRAGVKSVRAVADECGVPEGTIRSRAKKHGWTRNPEGAKRELVRAAMAGAQAGFAQAGFAHAVTHTVTHTAIRKNIESEADQDIADMRNGLMVARSCIEKLKAMVDSAEGPRDIKIIVEATKGAIETIRRIRGLDEPAPPATRDDAPPMSAQEAYMRMIKVTG